MFDWLDRRSAGLLLHLSSLPSETGIGNLGAGAFRFVDFLESAGQRVWQLCPLGPTGFGDSPYQCFSAFAGNPYFIDLEPLVVAELLERADLADLAALPHARTDYGKLYTAFWPVLAKAYGNFKQRGLKAVDDYGAFASFCKEQAHWLDNYTLFMALKDHFDGVCWLDWPAKYRSAAKAREQKLPKSVTAAAKSYAFYQYLFYAQLRVLRGYAASRGVEMMGDVPIFVALDSADVWANPELFQLDKAGKPTAVAGVPPDYFSADGQLWGNPLYDWPKHKKNGYDWWIRRIRSTLEFFDIVRLDHFRGFESYWKVPAGDKTARNGKWTPGPGVDLFKAVHKACPGARMVAEDLGVITDEVRALHRATGMPGMAVLHFAFGGDAGNSYLPHNHSQNLIAYSGTHDNDTSIGWFATEPENVRGHMCAYLGVGGEAVGWDLLRAIYRSPARMAIAPLQDLMNLGGEARLNRPGAPTGNWQWRYLPEQLEKLQGESAGYLRSLGELYGR